MHLGTVRPQDFGEGMTKYKPGGGRASILETRENGVMRQDTLLIYGLADSIHSEWSDKGAWVRMEGRDLRGVLLDAMARPSLLAKLKLSEPIDDVVAQIIALHPFGEQITISTNVDDWPGKRIPSPCEESGLTRVNLGAAKGKPGTSPQGDSNQLSVWDIITNYCFLVGAIPYFIGQTLYIRPSRSLYDRNKTDPHGNPSAQGGLQSTSTKTIGAGGATRLVHTSKGQEKWAIRHLVFGHDIVNLEFERKLGGIKVPQIEVVCLDTSSKNRGHQKLMISTYPPSTPSQENVDPEAVDEQGPNASVTADASTQKALTNDVAPGGQTHKQVIRIPISGVHDKSVLDRIARDLWEEIGRGEMGGKVSTKTLTSFGGSSQNPDLLSLRPGDPIEIKFDVRKLQSVPPLENSVTDTFRLPFEQQVQEVMKRIPDQNLARVLVATARNQVQELQSFFRVNNVRFGWAAEGEGVDIQFDFQNFLEARSDIDPQKKNTTPSKKRSVSGPKANVPRLPGSKVPPGSSGASGSW
jgi:hypothetical protein